VIEKKIIYPSEDVLEDCYPVFYDYCYVCDGEVRLSPLGNGSTVKNLKIALGVSEIRKCDMCARNLLG